MREVNQTGDHGPQTADCQPHHLRRHETTIMPASAEQVATEPTVAGAGDCDSRQRIHPTPQKMTQSATMPPTANQNPRPRSLVARLWSLTFWLACISIIFCSIDLLNESLRHLLTTNTNPASTSSNQVAEVSTSVSSLAKAATMMALLWFMGQVQPATSPLSTPQAGTQVKEAGRA